MLHANLMALSFVELELSAIEVYIVGIGIFDLFGSCDLDIDPMTFIIRTCSIKRHFSSALPTRRTPARYTVITEALSSYRRHGMGL